MNLLHPALAFLVLATASRGMDEEAYRAAVGLYTQHRPVEAEKAFVAIAAANPAHADTQYYLGQLALHRRDNDAALVYLEKAVSLAPGAGYIHLALGDAYGTAAQKAGVLSKIGLANKCKAEYQKAVELSPQSVDAHYSLMNYYLLAPGFLGGGTDKALVEAQAVKQLDADRGRFAVSAVYAADSKFDLAFAEFEEVLKVKPDDYTANYQVGRLAVVSGQRIDAGLAALRLCLAQPEPSGINSGLNHSRVQWRIGNLLEKKGDKAGAHAAYEASLALDPKFSQASESLKKL